MRQIREVPLVLRSLSYGVFHAVPVARLSGTS
jgi:hypothetical protein